MPLEIERKFLLANDTWRDHVVGYDLMRQGYLAADKSCSVRIRIHGELGFLNIKSALKARKLSCLKRAVFEKAGFH